MINPPFDSFGEVRGVKTGEELGDQLANVVVDVQVGVPLVAHDEFVRGVLHARQLRARRGGCLTCRPRVIDAIRLEAQRVFRNVDIRVVVQTATVQVTQRVVLAAFQQVAAKTFGNRAGDDGATVLGAPVGVGVAEVGRHEAGVHGRRIVHHDQYVWRKAGGAANGFLCDGDGQVQPLYVSVCGGDQASGGATQGEQGTGEDGDARSADMHDCFPFS